MCFFTIYCPPMENLKRRSCYMDFISNVVTDTSRFVETRSISNLKQSIYCLTFNKHPFHRAENIVQQEHTDILR